MDQRGRSTLDSLQRVQGFLTQNPLPDQVGALAPQIADLADVVARLVSQYQEQEASARYVRARRQSQRSLRSALYDGHMKPVAGVAREAFGVTGMDQTFRLPRNNAVTVRLVAAAGAMAEAAEQQHDVFVAHGMPADFVDQLRAATQQLAEAKAAVNTSARDRVTATAAAKDLLRQGRRAVRIINALLEPRLAADPELLVAWRNARRVAGASGSTAVVAPATQGTSVTPVPVAAAPAAESLKAA